MTNEKVSENLIFLGICGSKSYGTDLPTSDSDIVGVCIPPKEYYFGLKSFEQANKWTDAEGNKIDKTVYGIDKAIKLMAENNPNMLDLLFLPDRCMLIFNSEWKKFLDIRDSFISKKCRFSYSGYAHSQLERIKTHKDYLLNPISKPLRESFGLPSKSLFPDTQYEVIAKISDDFIAEENKESFYKEITQIIDSEMALAFRKHIKPELSNTGIDLFRYGQKEFLRTLECISSKFLKEEYKDAAFNELRFLSAYKNWKRYEEWKKNRNPDRAILEEKCGYDSKHASHLLRLLRMGIEILEGKGVLVDRTGIDADELKNIRLGNVGYEFIEEQSKILNDKLDESYRTSSLRHTPDFDVIEKAKIDVLEKHFDV